MAGKARGGEQGKGAPSAPDGLAAGFVILGLSDFGDLIKLIN